MENTKMRRESLHSCLSKNIVKNLMFRDFGFHGTRTAGKREIEFIVEKNLVHKEHKEMRCKVPGVLKTTFLMTFSPDGTKIASTHGDHNIYITDLATGKHIETLSGHPRSPWCIAFDPSSSHILASGCLGGQVRVWDLNGGFKVWNSKDSCVASLAFHPFARLLVIVVDNEIHFWNWSDSEPYAVITTRVQEERIKYVAFDRLGRKLITGIENIESKCPMNDAPSMHHRCRRDEPQPLQVFLSMERTVRKNGSLEVGIRFNESPFYSDREDKKSRPSTSEGRGQSRENSEPRIPDSSRCKSLSTLPDRHTWIPGFRHRTTEGHRRGSMENRSYRIQVWDFSSQGIPDITDAAKNVVVRKCHIFNDGSIDVSSDGKLLAALHRFTIGIYSLQWETLGEGMYIHSIKRNILPLSVSISPTQKHLLVGIRKDHGAPCSIALIYNLIDSEVHTKFPVNRDAINCDDSADWKPYREPCHLPLRTWDVSNSNVKHLRNNIILVRELSVRDEQALNCIKWAPQAGQSLVYATRTGQLNILY